MGLEGAVAVAQEHAHAGAFVIGGDDVGDAVAVEVGDGHRKRPLSGGIGLLRLERAVAVAQEHAHTVSGPVGGDDVGDAVAVEVRHHDLKGGRRGSGRGLLGSEGKGAVAVAQEHARRIVAEIGGDDVNLAIAVQVPYGDGTRRFSGGEGLLGLEGAVAVAQEHADRVVAPVGRDDVRERRRR